MKHLFFACGARLDVSEWDPATKRVVVFTNPPQGHERPIPGSEYLKWAELEGPPENYRVNCLLMCPLSERKSGRKVETGWLGEKQEHGRIVSCKIQRITETQDHENQAQDPTPNPPA